MRSCNAALPSVPTGAVAWLRAIPGTMRCYIAMSKSAGTLCRCVGKPSAWRRPKPIRGAWKSSARAAAAKFSTKTPKTLFVFENGQEQSWNAIDLGHKSAFETVTGGIFEFGFPDLILQMLAAFAAERAGVLGDKFGMATPDEAVATHQVWAAALQSYAEKRAIEIE